MDSFNAVMEWNLLPASMRRAIITLLFKKGARYLASNYHPISLTNVDYKILTYILSGKLQNYSDLLIHLSQTAYLPSHFMGTNICKVQDIITDIHNIKSGKVVFFLDFRKAFDSVDHTLLSLLLVRMKFPKSFITWIILLYPMLRIMVGFLRILNFPMG